MMLKFGKKENEKKDPEDDLLEARKGQPLSEQEKPVPAPEKKKNFVPFWKKNNEPSVSVLPEDLERFHPDILEGLSSAQATVFSKIYVYK